MRPHPVFLAAAAALAACASSASALDLWSELRPLAADDRPRLTLTFVDYTQLPAVAAVKAETAALIAIMGVEAEVRSLPPGAVIDPGGVTLVVMNGGAPAQLSRGVMGAVQRNGETRVLWIYSASVASGSGLRWSERNAWSPRERAGFATAMARVAVHEVVHLVCPRRGHDGEGLMAGVLGAAALTGSRIPFADDLRRDFTLGVDALSGAAFSVARGTAPPRH